ncbi:MAG TPA: hypothetical protein VFV08_07090 [Puia sp.]|nr:hypothetical protein [Puia sp.]
MKLVKIIAGVVIIGGGVGIYLWYRHTKKAAAAPAVGTSSTVQAPATSNPGLMTGDAGTVIGTAVNVGNPPVVNPTQTIMDSLTKDELDMINHSFCPNPFQQTTMLQRQLLPAEQSFIANKIYENHGKIGTASDLLAAIHKLKGC